VPVAIQLVLRGSELDAPHTTDQIAFRADDPAELA
jgi:hypothetical protein